MGLFIFLSLLGTASSVSAQATSDQYYAAGNQFYTAKDYNKAVLYYKAAIQVNPNNAAAHQGLGNTYYGLGQKSDALAEYQKALALNPNNPQLSAFVQNLQTQVGTSAPAAATPTAAHPAVSGVTTLKSFEFDVEAGVAFDNGSTGFGGGVAGYFNLDRSLSVGGIVGAYNFGSSASSTAQVQDPFTLQNSTETVSASASVLAFEILAAMKLKADGQGIRPYAVGGVGLSLLAASATASTTYNPTTTYYQNSSSSGSASSINPMAQVGGGAELSLGPDLNLFGEAKYSLIVGSGGTSSYIPIDIGVNFNL